jgi:hypothetical protein
MAPINKKQYYLIFFLFFITCGYFFQGGGWNQNTRICLTRAIIHQQSFIIDPYKEDSQDPYFEFVNTGDWSFKDGHYYTNKSPGLSMLAVPSFALTEFFAKNLSRADIEKQVHLSAYAGTLCTTVICASLLALLLFHVCNFFFGFSSLQSLLLTIFCGMGTLVFSYSTTFYCHVPSAFFSVLSFVLAMHLKHGTFQKKYLLGGGSGFAAAMAVLIEPSTVLALGCIFIYLLSFRDGRKAALFFLMGCIPVGVLQLFYNASCFGSQLQSSYNFPNPDVMWYREGKLFGSPSPSKLLKLLFLPYRGVLFSSPVLLMIIPGTFLLLKIKKWRSETIACLTISFVFLIFIACFYAWHGGTAAGPRYLLPAYPFAFLLTVFALKKFPKTYLALGALSIIINLSITLVGNEIPMDVRNPLTEVVLKNIMAGKVSINPVPFSNYENYSNIIMTLDTIQGEKNFNSFNLGELFFPNSLLSILPLLVFWAIWWLYWRRTVLKKTRNF